jgi:alkanesulfonate monooxygenase SsuD/methylene tetrahydromethanopterin reductase-like flavin-dependent oxidoreductase (luciferase family)
VTGCRPGGPAAVHPVKALLDGQTVDDREWNIKGARIAPLPAHGTEWWIGGSVARSIDRAARLGTCWYGKAPLTLQSAARLMDLYLEACARHDVHPTRTPIRKDVFTPKTESRHRGWATRSWTPAIEASSGGAVTYGDPQSVAEQLAPFGELGFSDVIIRTMTRGESDVRTVELAEEVAAMLA